MNKWDLRVAFSRLCDKNHIHISTKEHNGRRGMPNNTLPQQLPGLSEGELSAHHWCISTRIEEHRGEVEGRGTQITGSEEGTPYPGSF